MSKDKQQLLAFLRENSALREIGEDALHALSYLLRRRSFEDGDTIFSEGDSGAEAYLILEGSVEITAQRDDGVIYGRGVRGVGELFGELALFSGGRRTAGGRAKGNTTLAVLTYEHLVELIRAWPTVALALLRFQMLRFMEVEQEYRRLLESKK